MVGSKSRSLAGAVVGGECAGVAGGQMVRVGVGWCIGGMVRMGWREQVVKWELLA